jgi:tRNA (uracil-5-)-methyltransferase
MYKYTRMLGKEKSRDNVQLYDWLKQSRCISLDQIVQVPNILRNKCEFTFGYKYKHEHESSSADQAEGEVVAEGSVTKVPAVGFMATGWSGGVSHPQCCDNIPSEVCAIVDLVDSFLLTSPLPPYDSKVHKGFWRLLTVRTSRRTKECMVIIIHAPVTGGVGDSDDFSAHFASEKDRLVALLTQATLPIDAEETMKVTSIFYQEFAGLSNPPPEHPVQVSVPIVFYCLVCIPVCIYLYAINSNTCRYCSMYTAISI